MFDLSSCEQSLKKICSELEYEQNIVKSLADLAEFLDTTVKKIFEIVFFCKNVIYFYFFYFWQIEWIDSNAEQLKIFQASFMKISEMCSKANKYLKIENIQIPDNIDFEETISAELRQTTSVLQQIMNMVDDKSLIQAPNIESKKDFDYELLKE